MEGDRKLRDTIEGLRAECCRLREENERLRRHLVEDGIDLHRPPGPTVASEAGKVVRPKLGTLEKVALFRSLFRGREDVYAVRWQSPDGRSGYSPKTERDWKAYYAANPENWKRVDKETRRLLPLTNQVIREHLTGEQTIGIYPLLHDETCWFLAVDLDRETWHEDASAVLVTCRDLGVPAVIERSRSGNGGHVWIFFDRPISAVTARKLGSLVLTRTMERRHQIGLDSYDRFFPNQDTMPKGGFGNLIALPLQKIPRESGNSVFLNDAGEPHEDQWDFLQSIRRMSRISACELVTEAEKHGDLIGIQMRGMEDEDQPDPWTLPTSRRPSETRVEGPFPAEVRVVLSNLVFVEKKGLPPAMLNRLLRIAAFQNPEFYKAQAMRLSTFGKPRVIACGEDLPRHLALPRGSLNDVLAILEEHGIRPVVQDERFAGVPIEVKFHGVLRETQESALAESLRHDDGVLCAPTAFGKTAVTASLIANRKVNTLVLVHRQQLLDQWRERLAMFLDRPIDGIGQVGAGRTKRTREIDVAVIQSLYQKHEVKDFVAEYGHVVVDECHHLSAFTFEQVMRQAKAKYIVGLTATPTRKDGHHPIIYMQCGPARFSLTPRSITDSTPFEHVVIPRFTDFDMTTDIGELSIQEVYAALVADGDRNQLIANDLVRTVDEGRFPLVLTGRTEHLNILAERVSGRVKNVLILKGGMGRKQRRAAAEVLATLPEHEPRAILATGSYVGEGFDDARLDTLLLAMPISWKGTLQQYVGRLHRLHDDKRVVQVYDYVDGNIRMLARMYERRLKGYGAMGYRIVRELPEQARLL